MRMNPTRVNRYQDELGVEYPPALVSFLRSRRVK